MFRSAALGVVMVAALTVAGCTRTSGYPPASCAAAADLARDHINSFAEQLTPGKWPAVTAIENPVETKVETGTGRYKVRRYCAADARLADGNRARVLYVISDKQEGWVGGFGFYACVVGRTEGCKEDGA